MGFSRRELANAKREWSCQTKENETSKGFLLTMQQAINLSLFSVEPPGGYNRRKEFDEELRLEEFVLGAVYQKIESEELQRPDVQQIIQMFYTGALS
jgi:hypothetical protein